MHQTCSHSVKKRLHNSIEFRCQLEVEIPTMPNKVAGVTWRIQNWTTFIYPSVPLLIVFLLIILNEFVWENHFKIAQVGRSGIKVFTFFGNKRIQQNLSPRRNSKEILLQLITPLSEAFVEHDTEVFNIQVTEKVHHRISEETFSSPASFYGFFWNLSLPVWMSTWWCCCRR